MKTFVKSKTLFLLLLTLCCHKASGEGRVTLQSQQFTFEEQTVGEGFSISFDISTIPAIGTRLVEVPGAVSIDFIDGRRKGDDYGQNYEACPMPDGSVPVIEATLSLRLPTEGQPVEQMRVGVPIAALPKSDTGHHVVLSYTKASYTLYVDGKLVDNDYHFGEPAAVVDKTRLLVNNQVVSNVRLSQPALKASRVTPEKECTLPLQYFTPVGHNAWVGDVATCYYRGRYHLFYLYDRRGHRSKLGRGGHYFEHLSTADFLTWTEHPAATPIEEPWEAIGTGVPFVLGDSLFLSYGLHTSRLYPAERTATPMQWDSIRANGRSSAIPFSALREGIFPSGSTYSIAEDEQGNHFRKANVLIHPAENPTIYTEDGRLMMLANYGARGTWTSDRLDGGWRCVSENFPPGGDCTFIFPWGDYDYIVGGFTHHWMKHHSEPIEAYRDLVAEGRDLYDGLSVPAITALPDGRHIMAGWMTVNRHWGGTLVLRELVQQPDGTVGSRWMPELMSRFDKAHTLSPKQSQPLLLSETDTKDISDGSFLLTFQVAATGRHQSGHRLRLLLLPEEGEANACEWSIDLDSLRAQFAPGYTHQAAPRQKSLREGGSPNSAIDYAIEHLPLTKGKSIGVRLIATWNPKLGGAVLDAEINGQRTMICYRRGLRPARLMFCNEGTKVSKVQVSQNQ